ncbi:isthmin-1-like isoform X2 [Liolophura sinensis]|uniref:isthmin-1-like isoform X2 n=1 Tax=Liolophura sinensis TaxID=3198878 RepID=UPI0031582F6F
MTTPVVFVLCCNLLWISFHDDKSRVEGHEDAGNTTMLSLNISKQLPVSVAVLDEPEMVHSGKASEIPDSYLSKNSQSHQKNDRDRAGSQLLKENSRHAPLTRINENRVSVGKPLGHSGISVSKQDKSFSTPSAVVTSSSNKLHYVGNTTENPPLISERGDKHNFPEMGDGKQSTQVGVLKPTSNVMLTGPKMGSRLESNTETQKLEHSKSVNDREPRKIIANAAVDSAGASSDGPHSSLDQRALEPNARVSTDFRELSGETEAENPNQSKTTKTPAEMNDVNMQNNGSAWTEWGACTVSCGTGTQERSRACGANCQQVESRECYLDSCHGIMRGVHFSDVKVQEEFDFNDPTLSPSEVPKQTYLDTETDACEMWSTCKDEYLQRYMTHLSELANCPCFYPYNLENNNNVWDDNRRRYYQWVEVNSTEEKLSVYRPGAYKCIRSLLFPGAPTLAAQVCCYTHNLQLVTRGRNAGTPNLISPQISWELHYKIDILPWVICKGDWTRYNQVLSPNNMLGCAEFPDEDQLLEEVQEARDY